MADKFLGIFLFLLVVIGSAGASAPGPAPATKATSSAAVTASAPVVGQVAGYIDWKEQIDTKTAHFKDMVGFVEKSWSERLDIQNRYFSSMQWVMGLFMGLAATSISILGIISHNSMRNRLDTETKEILRESQATLETIKEEAEQSLGEIKKLRKEAEELKERIERDAEAAKIGVTEIESMCNKLPENLTPEEKAAVKSQAGESARKAPRDKTAKDFLLEGYAAALRGELSKAEGLFARATEIDPNFEAAWNNWGFALGEMGKYGKAIEKYRKATEIDPDYKAAWNNWGVALGEMGEYDKAIEKYRKATEIDPDYTIAHFNLARLYSIQHQKKAALESLERAVKLGFSLERIANDAGLDNIRETEGYKRIVG